MTTLYRFFDADERLLYIGIADNVGSRIKQHLADKPWWRTVATIKVEEYATRPEALEAERQAIRSERHLFNIVHNKPAAPTLAPPERFKFESRSNGFPHDCALQLYWEVNGTPLSDDYLPSELDAAGLWDMWISRYADSLIGSDGNVPIAWFIECADCGVFEGAPFPLADRVLNECFLNFYTWPRTADGAEVNWYRLPVMDHCWNEERSTKGGFLQEVTGWKPSPFQPQVNVFDLAIAANIPAPLRLREVFDAWHKAQKAVS